MATLNLKFIADLQDSDYAVIEFQGDMDRETIHNTEHQVEKFLTSFKKHFLVFDFSGLSFINSDGIGFIVSTHMKLAVKGQGLLLCGFKMNVADVINLVGLPKLIPVFQNMEDIIRYIKKK
jgi:anti-anti-sigma factor